MLKITHHASDYSGLFSHCSLKLSQLIAYFNQHKVLPHVLDTKDVFMLYKNTEDIRNNIDLTYEYFEHYDKIDSICIEYRNKIEFDDYYQYRNYKTDIDYDSICPFVQKYFAPSADVKCIIDNIAAKYELDYDNICVLFYRGNDKIGETGLCEYNDIASKARCILQSNENVRFLIQSDETQFIQYMMHLFPDRAFYFKDEIRHIPKQHTSVDKVCKETNFKFSQIYLGITIIMSKCKWVICNSSGNCSIWIALYRGNSNNLLQFMKDKWM